MAGQAESSNPALFQLAGADEATQVRESVVQTGVFSWLVSHDPSPSVWIMIWFPATPAAGAKSICNAAMKPPAPETLYGAIAMTLLPATRSGLMSTSWEVCQPFAIVEAATCTPLTKTACWSSTLIRSTASFMFASCVALRVKSLRTKIVPAGAELVKPGAFQRNEAPV